ncbi:MAG: L,D-transpeptidase family protein [Chitinophagales bacterium]
MKQSILLTSVLLGSGFLVFNTSPYSTGTVNKFSKRSNTAEGPSGSVYIVIDKSDYELSVYDSKGWYATYPVVFGNNSLDDKKIAGDKNTPEGSFRIANKRVHDKWDRYLGLDYPTQDSWDKFKKRKQNGEIPSSARIGGGIGIHGTWPNEDFVIDKYKNWTLGCISMKCSDVEELFNFTPVGTRVTIRK